VYLHGIADDRRGGTGIAQRFTPHGFEVIAYDSRAHGTSSGSVCTYGVLEKKDLARVLDKEPPGPVALIGHSLGGAVALQAAAEDSRISLVVAIAPYSDLRTVAIERAPFFASQSQIDRTFRLAEQEGGFAIDDASPLAAAPRIHCAVLLLHGAADTDTRPAHSRRLFDALACPKELIMLPALCHDDPLDDGTWRRIEEAIDALAR
jgi:pimeloyl-ACP methyl ester carboxylesterase